MMQALLSGVLIGAVYGLIAMGFSLAFGVMRIVNFAHGELVMVGMYIGVLLYAHLALDPLYALPVALVAVGLFGVGLYILIYSRFVGRATLQQLLAAIALALVIQAAAQLFFGPTSQGVQSSWTAHYLLLGSLFLSYAQLIAFGIAVVGAGAMELLLRGTHWGHAIRAVADDVEAAGLVGLDPYWINVSAFALSAALAGIAGAVLVSYYPASPTIGFTLMPIALIATVLGGLGSIGGAFLGGVLCGIIQQVTGLLWTPALQDVPLYFMLLLLLALRPQGLFGRATGEPPAVSSRRAASGPPLNARAAAALAWMTPRRLAFGILLIATVASLPITTAGNSYIVGLAVRMLLLVALGQSWNLIAGIGGQLSLGHGVFFGIGAYVPAMLFNSFGLSPWLGLWAGILTATLVALLMGAVTFRLRGVYFALATIVISLGLEKLTRYFSALTGGDSGLSVQFRGDAPDVMQWRGPAPFLWLSLAVVIGFYFLTRGVLNNRFGIELQAVRDDEEAAAAAGVHTYRTKLLGLLLSAAMAAVVGTLHVQFYLAIDPGTAFGLFHAIQIQLPALIGGIGTAGGPVIGGAFLIFISELTNVGSTKLGLQGFDILIYGLTLLAVVLKAPEGLLGRLRMAEAVAESP